MGGIPVKYKGNILATLSESGELDVLNHAIWAELQTKYGQNIPMKPKYKGMLTEEGYSNTTPVEYVIEEAGTQGKSLLNG